MSNARCGRCGGALEYAGEPCYTCSPRSWIADYKRRQRGEPQTAALDRAMAAISDRADRRQASRSTYRRILGEMSDEQAVARALATRSDDLAVIARAQARSRGHSPREASRAAGVAYAHGPNAAQCSGPDCPICSYSRSLNPAPARSPGATYRRVYPLDGIRIIRRAQGGDGRTVEAYAAVFDDPAEIHDSMGHYHEVIDPGAWNDRLAEARRARGGLAAEIKVLFNHGMTRSGTPSDKWSLTIGKPLDIRPDSRGLLTITRYSDDEVLAKIQAGEITSQSFVGACVRSSPELPRGGRYGRDGTVPVVRRMKLGLREYGPVLWPAYSGAEILGVRMERPR